MRCLHEGLKARGIHSTLACRRAPQGDPTVVELPRRDRLEKAIGGVTWRLGLNDLHCVSSFALTSFPPFIDADLVNIQGWHSQFFSYLALPRLARRKPIVATLHDMWNLTGHCGYSRDCERWKTGCGRCPYPDEHPPVARDATRLAWKLKRRAYRRSPDMHVVAQSGWLAEQVRQSMLSEHRLHQINYGIDTERYCLIDQSRARAALDLPNDRRVLLFAAADLSRHVKGGDLLAHALVGLPEEVRTNLLLLLMGDNADSIIESCGLATRALGYVKDHETRLRAYAAADLFVIPSRAEVQGLVALEAMACGTPVVGFAVGGIADAVRPGVSGLTAPPENVESLRDAIGALLTDSAQLAQLRDSARQLVCDEFSESLFIQRYIDLFEDVVEERRSVSRG